jgi:hypothetical protein
LKNNNEFFIILLEKTKLYVLFTQLPKQRYSITIEDYLFELIHSISIKISKMMEENNSFMRIPSLGD